ncbi:17321_t:CDS:2, partial [Gigaspora rosea]
MDESDIELEALIAYDSAGDFSKTDSSDDDENILELSVGKKDATTCQILKRTYLYRHAGNPSEKLIGTSCREKNCPEVTTFNNQHIGHELHPLANRFDPTLRKLSKKIVEEIRFLTVVAKADATMQYRIIQEKYKTRIHRPDLYNTISRFYHDSEPGKEDTEIDPITSSLTHLFWMSTEQQILWLRYHDVIMHDNTCKTNCYNQPLSLFVTPDNNLKTRIVAQAIVDDETQSSY